MMHHQLHKMNIVNIPMIFTPSLVFKLKEEEDLAFTEIEEVRVGVMLETDIMIIIENVIIIILKG